MLITLRRLRSHFEWADERALAALRAVDAPPADAVGIYAHLVAAAEVWLSRIEGRESALPVWPEADLDLCSRITGEVHERLAAYLETLDEQELEREVAYRNSAGQAFKTPVREILLHVFLHGTYHRGQIAQRLRQSGYEPAATDYIGWVRGVPAATRDLGPLNLPARIREREKAL